MRPFCLFVFLLILFSNSFGQKSPINLNKSIVYPKTNTVAQVDTFFGKAISDPYRWLENENSSETKSWVEEQNKTTNKYLNSIPFRDNLRQRIATLWNFARESSPWKVKHRFFKFVNNGLQNQSVLMTKKENEKEYHVLLDPNTLSKEGTTSLNTYSVSKNGKYLCYGLSEGGSDWQTFYILDIENGTLSKEKLTQIKFSGASWYQDGFYYSKYESDNKENFLSAKNTQSKVYYHTVGTDQSQDKLIYADDLHPDWSFNMQVTDNDEWLCLYVYNATSNNMLKIKKNDASKHWISLSDNFENEVNVIDNVFENKDALLIATNRDAPNIKIVQVNLDKPEYNQWQTIIPEAKNPIHEYALLNDKILVHRLNNIQSEIKVYDGLGKYLKDIELPKSVIANLGGVDKKANEVFISYSSYVIAPTVVSYNLFNNEAYGLFKTQVPIDLSQYQTQQVTCKSKDGTAINLFVTSKKNIKLDGNNPTLLYGYGGFNISITPDFVSHRLSFLEQGGIWVTANLRGGAEFGEEWHKAGMMFNKQNVFDDFIAAAEFLIEKGYTSKEKLGVYGRSNGGLLIGAVTTQRPDLFAVALPVVGVLDMLRYHKFTIGYFWATEYGSAENKNEFENLLSYSPLHNLSQQKYPATLVLTGDHDDRVVPAHSYKFISQLQQSQEGENPCLIRIDVNAGHGSGKPTSKLIDEWTDMYAFLLQNVGHKYINIVQ